MTDEIKGYISDKGHTYCLKCWTKPQGMNMHPLYDWDSPHFADKPLLDLCNVCLTEVSYTLMTHPKV